VDEYPIADSGYVVAVANEKDRFHKHCVEVHLREPLIYLPYTTLSEVGYYLQKELGNAATARFIRALPQSKYRLIALADEDFLCTAEIMEQYSDIKLDFVDATIVAMAERLDIKRILTVDQRDYQIIRPRHTPYFEILPQ
jgi:uncharacterized protein